VNAPGRVITSTDVKIVDFWTNTYLPPLKPPSNLPGCEATSKSGGKECHVILLVKLLRGESVSLSFVSQSLHRLYGCGAASRSPACHQSDERQQQSGCCQDNRIIRMQTVKE
jgi:hypothetical protein